MIYDKCDELEVKVISLKIFDSYIDMVVECPPDISPNLLLYRIKSTCNVSELKSRFPVLEKSPNLWTRGSLISTDPLCDETIANYVSSQKNRY